MNFFIISYYYRLASGVTGPGEIAWICNPYPIRDMVVARVQKDFQEDIQSFALINILPVTKEQFETYITPYEKVKRKKD